MREVSSIAFSQLLAAHGFPRGGSLLVGRSGVRRWLNAHSESV
jgi:hypothetical protein